MCEKKIAEIGVNFLPTIRNLRTLLTYFNHFLTWEKPEKYRYWQNFTYILVQLYMQRPFQ